MKVKIEKVRLIKLTEHTKPGPVERRCAGSGNEVKSEDSTKAICPECRVGQEGGVVFRRRLIVAK